MEGSDEGGGGGREVERSRGREGVGEVEDDMKPQDAAMCNHARPAECYPGFPATEVRALDSVCRSDSTRALHLSLISSKTSSSILLRITS